MSRYINPRFDDLEAYVPGEQPQDKEYIKLNTNESPYPPSPEVIKRISPEKVSELNLYPDPTGHILKEKIAALCDVKPENVFLANGSDEVLDFSFMAFGGNGAVYPDITYGFYPVFAALNGIYAQEIPLREDFTLDHRDYLGAGKLVVIANPNAPTSLAIPVTGIEEILKSNPDNVVLIDEAYVDFGGESAVSLVQEYDNLLVTQTFSKSRSMAGARLGFGVGAKDLIDDLEKIKYSTNPYNINRLTMAAGEAAIDSNDYYMDNVKKIIATRDETARKLKNLGFEVLDSKTNFLFVRKDGIGGSTLYEGLKTRGILVRYFDRERTKDFVRISIGTPEQMEKLVSAIRDIA